MSRTPMTDEERVARAEARKALRIEKREAEKYRIRAEIDALARQIPLHIVQGGVEKVRAWKDALDSAVAAMETGRISIERLASERDSLRSQCVEQQPVVSSR